MRLKYLLGAAGLVASVAVTLVGGTRPSEAMILYPWCAHYGGRISGGAPNCGFTTIAQCMATVSGTQGTCEMNPWYEFPPQPQRARRRAAQ